MVKNWMERVSELILAKQYGQAVTKLKVTVAEDSFYRKSFKQFFISTHVSAIS
jgi:hypothetical protein